MEQDGNVAVLAPLLSGTTEEIADALAALRSISSRLSCDHEQSCDTRSGPPLVGWVVRGTVRKYLIRASGQRRIVDLLIPGDFFGFYQASDECSLQAVTDDTVVARCTLPSMIALSAINPAIGRLLYERACQAIVRLERHVLTQGRTRAPEKVGSYLLSMARRLGKPSSRTVDLPVTRYDIADHLGLAVETVSRAITELRSSGAIQLRSPRQIAIVDRYALADGAD